MQQSAEQMALGRKGREIAYDGGWEVVQVNADRCVASEVGPLGSEQVG